MRRFELILATLALLGAVACGITATPTQTLKSAVQSDLQKLATWFDLSGFPPAARVQWVQRLRDQADDRIPAPTDYYVLAVLEFSAPVEAETLGLAKDGEIYVEDSLLESWLPAAIVSRFTRTPEGYLKFDGQAYKADAVLLPPLTYGYILIVDEYVLIYGATM